jgi:hypothetical protein
MHVDPVSIIGIAPGFFIFFGVLLLFYELKKE